MPSAAVHVPAALLSGAAMIAGAALLGGVALLQSSLPGAAQEFVVVRPGADLRAAAEAYPPGTVFMIAAGIHRRQRIVPKDRQAFVGEAGAILDGSIPIGGWQEIGGTWVSAPLPPPLSGHGEATDPLALRREDLFVGGVLFRRVAAREALAPGAWVEEEGRAVLAETPGDRLVELGQAGPAFSGSAVGVRIEQLEVRRYATDAQQGAIDGRGSRDWRLSGVVSAWNHGAGLELGDGMRVEGGSFIDNGQLGIGGGPAAGDGSVIERVVVARNNFAGFEHGWEAGGIKLLGLTDVALRANRVEGNRGAGIWVDTDNRGVIIEGNCIRENDGIGIQYETSRAGTIHGNAVLRNALSAGYRWPWGAAILIQNSSGVEVTGNLVAVGRGEGIVLLHQRRGSGAFGPHNTSGNRVARNTVLHLRASGRNGMFADADPAILETGNVWDSNLYVTPPGGEPHWVFGGAALAASSFAELARRGQELQSQVRETAETGAELARLLPAWCQ
jgi:hypothetical protein